MYVYGSVPFFECLVRAEYTRNLRDRHGEYYKAVVHAVRCVRGSSLWFQAIFTEKHGGAAFMVPIEALVFTHRGAVQVLDPKQFVIEPPAATIEVPARRVSGQYRFTIDCVGTDLAEHPDQHKALHVVFRSDGLIGAYPNNRLLWHDPAFWEVTRERPDFLSLEGEFRAEGNQELVSHARAEPIRPLVVNGWVTIGARAQTVNGMMRGTVKVVHADGRVEFEPDYGIGWLPLMASDLRPEAG